MNNLSWFTLLFKGSTYTPIFIFVTGILLIVSFISLSDYTTMDRITLLVLITVLTLIFYFRAKAETYKRAFRSSNSGDVGLCKVDRNDNIIYANEAFKRIFSVSRSVDATTLQGRDFKIEGTNRNTRVQLTLGGVCRSTTQCATYDNGGFTRRKRKIIDITAIHRITHSELRITDISSQYLDPYTGCIDLRRLSAFWSLLNVKNSSSYSITAFRISERRRSSQSEMSSIYKQLVCETARRLLSITDLESYICVEGNSFIVIQPRGTTWISETQIKSIVENVNYTIKENNNVYTISPYYTLIKSTGFIDQLSTFMLNDQIEKISDQLCNRDLNELPRHSNAIQFSESKKSYGQ